MGQSFRSSMNRSVTRMVWVLGVVVWAGAACGTSESSDYETVDGIMPEMVDVGPDLACTPSCETAVCGDNGCNGVCGICATGFACDEGYCVPPLECGDQECAKDWGEDCLSCPADCGGCGDGTCAEIADCMMTCGLLAQGPCVMGCLYLGTEEAVTLFDQLYVCATETCTVIDETCWRNVAADSCKLQAQSCMWPG